jgi:hypothetical protein
VKYLSFIGLAILIGCTTPNGSSTTATQTKYVVDSFKRIVKTVQVPVSRDVASDTLASIQAEVDAFNLANDQVQQYILDDPANIPPLANVFIIQESVVVTNGVTHTVRTIYFERATPLLIESSSVVRAQYPDIQPVQWDRASLLSNLSGWQSYANSLAAVLYVDKVPNLSAPYIDPRTNDEKYSYTILDSNGHIALAYNQSGSLLNPVVGGNIQEPVPVGIQCTEHGDTYINYASASPPESQMTFAGNSILGNLNGQTFTITYNGTWVGPFTILYGHYYVDPNPLPVVN